MRNEGPEPLTMLHSGSGVGLLTLCWLFFSFFSSFLIFIIISFIFNFFRFVSVARFTDKPVRKVYEAVTAGEFPSPLSFSD